MFEIFRQTEELWKSLDEDDLEFIGGVDAARLEVERARISPQRRDLLKNPAYGIKKRFLMWEGLIFRMENKWEPDGYYLFDEYLNDLESRSALSEVVESAPDRTSAKLSTLLSLLDKRFFEKTVLDGGLELGKWRKVRPSAVDPVLWERRPLQLPWSA